MCVCVCVCYLLSKYTQLAPGPGPWGTLYPTLSPATGLRKTPSHVPCARRYASAVAYMLLSCVRLSAVSPSQVGSPIETTGRIELVFGMEASLYLSHTTCKEIRVLPSDLENFATEVDGRACSPHLYDNRRVVAVYYKSINCNLLTPLLRFVVALLYNLFL